MTEPVNPIEQPRAVPPATAAPPVVPDHELIRLIGSGASGQVWLARNVLGTYRAVKIVQEQAFRHQRPFEREFEGILNFEPLSRLHDGLVNILHVGFNQASKYFYCVMELADDVNTGQNINPETYQPRTLECDTAVHRRLSAGECIRVGATIASALSFLHRHGLSHRDIKPSNIIFINGFPRLADVGLVTGVSGTRAQVGTEGFIPPEGSGTEIADIYSLGKVLYEISTGLDRNDYPELPANLGRTREDCDLLRLNRIVLKACRANPWARYRSADDLLLALLSFQFGIENPRREILYRRLVKIAGIVGILVIFGVSVAAVWHLVWLLKHSP
jgi:serine/threonine protein kinase